MILCATFTDQSGNSFQMNEFLMFFKLKMICVQIKLAEIIGRKWYEKKMK